MKMKSLVSIYLLIVMKILYIEIYAFWGGILSMYVGLCVCVCVS